VNAYEFRGRRRYFNGWVIGHGFLIDNAIVGEPEYVWDDKRFDWCEVIPETVGQFTGVIAHKSHRGTEEQDRRIFAGDVILRHGTGSSGKDTAYKFIIVFEKGCFQLKRPDNCYRSGLDPNGFSLHEDYAQREAFNKEDPKFNCFYEIIGNIHDNPEHIPPWALGNRE
jgi:hypothetical protein